MAYAAIIMTIASENLEGGTDIYNYISRTGLITFRSGDFFFLARADAEVYLGLQELQ